jgi:hypothetical protein
MHKLTRERLTGSCHVVKPYVAFDADVKGFGCRVMPSGAKTFILEYRPGAGGARWPSGASPWADMAR